MLKTLDKMMIDTYRKEAAELGLTLQEYLLYRVLDKMDDLSVVAYVED